MDCSTRGLSFPISWSFPKFMKITLYQTTFPDLGYGKMQLLQHNTRRNEAVGYLSRSWWWAGKPGVLQSMGSQRVDTTERLNWTELRIFSKPLLFLGPQFPHLEKDRRRDRVVFSQTQNSIFCHVNAQEQVKFPLARQMNGSWTRAVLSPSWVLCTVLQGLNNILWCLAKGKTPTCFKTKERSSSCVCGF